MKFELIRSHIDKISYIHLPRHRASKQLRLHIDVKGDRGVAADVGHGRIGLVVLHPDKDEDDVEVCSFLAHFMI